jgi:hypothetical protein
VKWKPKEKFVNTDWHIVFAWKPVITEDNHMVWLEKVERRYRVHMTGGSFVYKSL